MRRDFNLRGGAEARFEKILRLGNVRLQIRLAVWYITEVDLNIEDGDTFFPEFDINDFEVLIGETLGAVSYTHLDVYKRQDIIKREQDFNVSLDYLSENEFFDDEKECTFYKAYKLIQYIHCLLYTSRCV